MSTYDFVSRSIEKDKSIPSEEITTFYENYYHEIKENNTQINDNNNSSEDYSTYTLKTTYEYL
ncbi:MAG: hypothetical protein N2749_04765 [Clostridia bacterium]|nr:hypothetical protein [Clostridia bacterium]